ncbi:major facilitator superfamily domain-containing protein [Aspergillus pseudotamarii]|uniref:Major facilitator superfamily domain-containing protein n=1 Tax=Aspergillus pseudotamarii TaxID=132259 RepID=A0A5N6SU34_ASPPS|nr:major facilitator superfamily domain-containing protein [Aspergillus pseudotamarii]KAE8137407.1 major facilitator superfamily domain-containing protein [Aspergillus pseudotamarii]
MPDEVKYSLQHDEKAVSTEKGMNNRVAAAQQMSSAELAAAEKSLKRKLDARLLLSVWIMFVMNYLDRLSNNIATAKVAGIAKSLHMTSEQYATAVAIIFAGYVLMQLLSNIFLAQMRPSWYLPGVMTIWGMLSALVGETHNAGGLYALRFLLGFIEAAFYPGALFLVSSWYRRDEMGVRSAFLFSRSQLGSAFSGLIAAGIESGMNGVRGLESWRLIFIIEGSATPSNTRWPSPTERAVAQWHLIADAGQVDEDDGRWSYGFKSALSDWRLYIFALTFLCIQVSSATTNFFPSVVQTLGINRVDTLLLTVPPYIVALLISIGNNWSADRFKNSSYHIIWPLVLAIIGFVIVAATLNTGARDFAMIAMVAGGHGPNAVLLAWVQKTMLRPRIKRASAVAFVNAVGNISQIFSSYLYPDSSLPRYVLAMSVNAAFSLAVIILTLFMRIVLLRTNKRLARGETTVEQEMKGGSQAELLGVTEEECATRREEFRFIA